MEEKQEAENTTPAEQKDTPVENVEHYDSRIDSFNHTMSVQTLLKTFIIHLMVRQQEHDQSKRFDPEKELFDKYTPKLAGMTYGSDEYKECLVKMRSALEHHYANNDHHPEFWGGRVDGMHLLAIIEMLCDWKAASMRHNDGDILKSIEINQDRFGYGDELKQIFINTVRFLSWAEFPVKKDDPEVAPEEALAPDETQDGADQFPDGGPSEPPAAEPPAVPGPEGER